MNLRFEQPTLLLLGLLALPLLVIGLRTLAHVEPVRRWIILLLRTFLIVLVAAMLAGPHAVREHDQLAVVALVDVSGSVRRFAHLPPIPDQVASTNIDYLRWWMRESDTRRPDDRFGIVAFDGQPVVISAPSRGAWIGDNIDLPMMEGSNLAEAIRLSLATLPADASRRLVLFSDGNETLGDAREAARQAAADGAGGVPIDVVPIEYRIENDVQIVRVESPPSAQPGQTVTVRIVMRSAQPTSGLLSLRREGEPVDLSPGTPGTPGHSRRIALPAGQSVHLAQVTLGQLPINRFEATFDPDDPSQDVLPENNRASAFTATPSRGSVLVLTTGDTDSHPLTDMLQHADIPAVAHTPTMLPDDLLGLQNFDLIVLDNVPAYEFDRHQQQLLAHYVDRLGGGLIMLGGERSFGAGAWMRTPIAEILPVQLDPPRELRSPTAALVLVIDRSGSMTRSVAGARASQQEVANEAAALAVESLQSETYIGVVAFDHSIETLVPMRLNDDPEAIANRIRTITAAGGTQIEPALRHAHSMLREVDVQQRHIVLLTDGISHDPTMDAFIELAARDSVHVTTIGVGDDIDRSQLRAIAEGTDSVFHHVRNPRALPRVLVDSVQEFNKPLIKEGMYQPVVRPTGSMLAAGMESAPPLDGIVITAPREEPTIFLDMIHPDGEPLLAHWQVGLGRAAAFMSDLGGPWSRRWDDWPGAQAFWLQLVRTTARPAVSRETELTTFIHDGRLHISLEAADEQQGFLDYLTVDGTVYLPDGNTLTIRLRQTAPGRYEAEAAAPQSGSYIVALNPRHGARQLTPVIGGASRSTSDEFQSYESNIALLEEIAELTGGRVLSIYDPQQANLFDRTGMPSSASLLPAWRRLLWWVIALLLLDVAARRLAWDWPLIKRGLAAAIERVTPARVKGQRSLATLGGLQQASARLDAQHARQSEHVEKLSGTGEIAPPPQRFETTPQEAAHKPDGKPDRKPAPTPATQKRTAPDESRVSAALDAFLGRSPRKEEPQHTDTQTSKPSQAKPSKKEEEEDAARPSPTSSGLLAAKRRARERIDRDR